MISRNSQTNIEEKQTDSGQPSAPLAPFLQRLYGFVFGYLLGLDVCSHCGGPMDEEYLNCTDSTRRYCRSGCDRH